MRGSLRGHDHHLAALHEHAAQQRASIAQSAAEAWASRDAAREDASAVEAPGEAANATDAPAVQLANQP